MPGIAEARAFLSKVDENGISLGGHITDVLSRILNAKPEAGGLDAFEQVSLDAKAGAFKAGVEAPPLAADAESSSEWQKATNALLAVPPGEEAEEDADLVIPNMLEEMRAFEMAGVGLSREETHRIFVSIHKLQQTKKLSSVRFFGKVLGTGADYYVAEGKYVEDPEPPEAEEGAPPPPVPVEERGTGCNTFTYFVTTDVSQPWVELPQVTPAQISGAMLVRKFVTGDLGAEVRAYPPFPGKEKEYLRAQIARIVAATTLSPKGKFTLDPEEPGDLPFGVKPTEEYAPLPAGARQHVMRLPGRGLRGRFEEERRCFRAVQALGANAANWARSYMGVLQIGRCTNPPKEEEEEEGEEGAAKPKGPEPEAEATQLYSRVGAGAAVAVARSLVWPGAYAAAVQKEDKCANLYIGYGHEALSAPFQPQPPPAIMEEPDDLAEQEDMPLKEENALYRAQLEKELAEAPDEAPAEE